ncbi:hypothetical protein M433DRAFT_421508 [Acidomyces richmondensis BFW]|nr:hypothetical protein M433DRAFT_421508 [Acidomyces richmondensis BFW]
MFSWRRWAWSATTTVPGMALRAPHPDRCLLRRPRAEAVGLIIGPSCTCSCGESRVAAATTTLTGPRCSGVLAHLVPESPGRLDERFRG